MQRTPNYNLPQFEPTDKYTLEDYNNAYQIIDTILKQSSDGATSWNAFKNNGGFIGGAISAPNIHTPRGSIATGVDANKLLTPGVYQVTPGVTNINNIGYGLLTVEYSGGYFKQTLSDLGATRETFIRQSGDGGASWSGWFGDGRGVYNNSTNGYTKLPNGMILQWGTIPSALIGVNGSIGVQVTLPITFPTTILNVNACCTYNLRTSNATDISKVNCTVNLRSTSQIDVYGEDVKGITTAGNFEIKWHAIGY